MRTARSLGLPGAPGRGRSNPASYNRALYRRQSSPASSEWMTADAFSLLPPIPRKAKTVLAVSHNVVKYVKMRTLCLPGGSGDVPFRKDAEWNLPDATNTLKSCAIARPPFINLTPSFGPFSEIRHSVDYRSVAFVPACRCGQRNFLGSPCNSTHFLHSRRTNRNHRRCSTKASDDANNARPHLYLGIRIFPPILCHSYGRTNSMRYK